MIKSLKLKNFKSFKDLDLNFETPKFGAKNLHLIYGENGSGKSNLISVFSLLANLKNTLKTNERFADWRNSVVHGAKFKDNHEFDSFFSNLAFIQMMNIPMMIERESIQYKGADDPIEIAVTFDIDQNEAEYFIKLDKKEGVIEEKLKYVVAKNRGTLYHIKNENGRFSSKFSPNLFNLNKIKNIFEDDIESYWGNHTFLSILEYELTVENINRSYLIENMNENLIRYMNATNEISVDHKGVMMRQVVGNNINEVFENPIQGDIKKSEKNKGKLQQAESMITSIFSTLYTDIEDAFYSMEEVDDTYKYELYLSKNIGDRTVDIPFRIESSGTRQILRLVPMMISLIQGKTVIIDEIDSEVHDLLMKVIIEGLLEVEIGQLIATTHNTLLLQSINKRNAYVIDIDYRGNKEILNLGTHDNKIQATNSLYSQYVLGHFGGVPYVDYFDVEDLLEFSGIRDEE